MKTSETLGFREKRENHMKITLDKMELDAALQLFKKLRAAHERHVQPALRVESGRASIQGGSNLRWQLNVQLPSGREVSDNYDAISLDVESTIKALKPLDKGYIRLASGRGEDGTRLSIADESDDMMIAPLSDQTVESEESILPSAGEGVTVSIEAALLHEGLTFVEAAVTKNAARPILETVFFEATDSGFLRLTGTDSYVLNSWEAVVSVDPLTPFKQEQEWWPFVNHKSQWSVIHISALKPLMPLLKQRKDSTVDLSFLKDGSLEFCIHGHNTFTYRRRSDYDNWMNYESAVPDYADAPRWYVGSGDFASAVTKAAAIKGRLDFSVDADHMRINVEEYADVSANSGKSLSGEFLIDIAHTDIVDAESEFHLNPDRLIKVAGVFKKTAVGDLAVRSMENEWPVFIQGWSPERCLLTSYIMQMSR